jgi:hypothetical protein
MRLKKSRKTVIKFCTILIAVFLFPLAASSQDDKSTLTLVYDKISLVDLLAEIEEQSPYYFLYSPDDLQDRYVKADFQERSVSYILRQVFGEELLFKKSGNEIVVYQNRDKQNTETKTAPEISAGEEQQENADPADEEILRVDTVFQVRYDTIFLKDTVIIRDTVMITDTIFKQKVVKNAYKKKTSFENTLLNQQREQEYYLNFHLGPVIGNTVYEGTKGELVDRYSDAFSGALSYTLGIEGGIRKNNFFAETGLAIRNVREGFEYTFEQPEQTYYETDTLDTYYTLDGQDTTWYFVTDSTQQVIPGYDQYFKNSNEYTFLDIPVYIGYRIMLGRVDLEVKGGVTVEALLKKEGFFIVDEENFPVSNLDELNSNIGLSGRLELGGIYDVNRRLGVFAKINMRTSFVDTFKDSYPVERSSSAVSLKFGLRASF